MNIMPYSSDCEYPKWIALSIQVLHFMRKIIQFIIYFIFYTEREKNGCKVWNLNTSNWFRQENKTQRKEKPKTTSRPTLPRVHLRSNNIGNWKWTQKSFSLNVRRSVKGIHFHGLYLLDQIKLDAKSVECATRVICDDENVWEVHLRISKNENSVRNIIK